MNKKNINEKIDFVMIWVDGNDENWRNEKEKYSQNKNKKSDSRNIRYRDWDNLKYWFRGVEKFAPWVNKIYFVTCGHLPKWLNTNNPKLVCVKHSDYMPEEYLPTFSSHPIELNLHRINGLSEKFVYFNDDTFIINNVKPTDFFKDGKPCSTVVFQPATSSGEDELFISVKNNVNMIINRHFNKKEIVKKNLSKYLNFKYGKLNLSTLCCMPYQRILGFHEEHNGTAYLKSTFKEVWEKEYDILNETCKHKFRTPQDVNQYLIENWQFCKGNFEPRKQKTKFIKIFENVNKACDEITSQKVPMICLNDSASDEKTFEEAKMKINNSLEKILSEKSHFEK